MWYCAQVYGISLTSFPCGLVFCPLSFNWKMICTIVSVGKLVWWCVCVSVGWSVYRLISPYVGLHVVWNQCTRCAFHHDMGEIQRQLRSGSAVRHFWVFFLLASSMQNSIILAQLNTVCLPAFCLGRCSFVLNVLRAVWRFSFPILSSFISCFHFADTLKAGTEKSIQT